MAAFVKHDLEFILQQIQSQKPTRPVRISPA